MDNNNDMKPVKRGFSNTLVAALLISLAVFILSLHAVNQIRIEIEANLSEQLKAFAATTHKALKLWADDRKTDARFIIERPDVKALIKELLTMPPEKEHLSTCKTMKELRDIFGFYLTEHQDLGFFLISPDHINIASMHNENLGEKNIISKHGNYLKDVFNGQARLVLPVKSDMPLPVPEKGGELRENEPTMFVAVPVFGKGGKVIAAFAIRIDVAREFTGIIRIARIAQTADPYAFDKNGRLISESRFDEHLRSIGLIKQGERGILNITLRDPGGNMLEGFRPGKNYLSQPLTKMARSATAGNAGIDVKGYRDYRGVPVIGAWLWDEELELGLTFEIDVAEAYRPYYRIRSIVLILLSTIIVIFILCATAIIKRNRSMRAFNIKLCDEITERKRLEKELVRQATTDSLTQALNRTKFEDIVEREMDRARRFAHPLSMIIIDIDNFKQVNDTCGHLAGDEVLKKIASIIDAHTRKTNFFFRWGGEEFLILAVETRLTGAARLSKRMRQEIEKQSYGTVGSVTASFGLAEYRKNETRDELVKRADDALYSAKKLGRNRVVTEKQ